MGSFLTLEALLAPLPFPAIIAILMVLGLQFLGKLIIKRLRMEAPGFSHYAAGFILATALVAAAVHLLAQAQMAYIAILRPIAVLLAGLGIWQLFYLCRSVPSLSSRAKAIFREQNLPGKTAMVLLGLTGLGLLLAALGPPTDSDSLCYHLGVPLDILRHHGLYPRRDWLHARLTGLGESLNLLGLAGGTDIFGAVLQFAGVLTVLSAVTSLAQDNRDKLLLSLGVLGCPVLAFLVPNQKPMMLPVAATTVALLLIAQRFRTLDAVTILLSFSSVFFAISCKYSFLLTGAVVILMGLIGAYHSRIFGKAIIFLLASFMVFAFPLYLQNYLFYGDPISPFLERFRADGNPIVINFAYFLRDLKETSIWPAPLKFLLPDSLGKVSTVLGLVPLLSVIGLQSCRKDTTARVLAVSAILAVTVILLFSQVNARFLLEPVFWSIPLAALVEWGPIKSISLRLLAGQTLIMALVVWFGAFTLFPGALTANLRHKIMARSADDYLATRWLDKVLPQNSVVLAGGIRSLALMGRPFMSGDYLYAANLEKRSDRANLLAMMRSRKVNALVTYFPLSKEIKQNLGPYLGPVLAGPQDFLQGKRNPWNRTEESLVIYRINPNATVRKIAQSGDNYQGKP